jgi:hypothetical protein
MEDKQPADNILHSNIVQYNAFILFMIFFAAFNNWANKANLERTQSKYR